MSQLLKDQTVLEEANEVKLLQDTLSDGSHAYNVLVDRTVIFYCEDHKEASMLFGVLQNTDHQPVH